MKKIIYSLSLTLALFSGASFATDNFKLATELSSISFATIKNQFIVEPASINMLSGSLDKTGQFNLFINMKGIETGIPIRNTRLNDIFFESAKHAAVTINGKIDWSKLDNGSHKITVPAKVSLFGTTKSINFPVVILKTEEVVMVSSSSPVIIGAADFGIPSENLTTLAATVGGIKISDRVPLTLTLTFKK
ncbi:hypothetical protein CJF42_11510 [Pseudoalteromonas sp. NBT06-2]|uniref:YceI family protein n=1 Tax=Pseudoalteromonas sp. NBT06-2 TaxID=2025950 RepID=UPI000BA6C7FC|nr:YceI family protein [Pseudoalteromonas sp. NBT06-2]PAJ74210.1 hypothetical protein CJF42_11510 [Pseudoalteromonas sp. NBT06-2]